MEGFTMDWFNIFAGVSSILGLVVSIASLIVSCFTLNKVSKIDSSQTENNLKNTTIGGGYIGRDGK